MSKKDLSNPTIRVVENFIDDETCDYLISYAEKENLWHNFNNSIKSYVFKDKQEYTSAGNQWNDRRVDINELYLQGMENRKDLFDIVVPLQYKMHDEVVDFFSPDFELHSELWEIVRWREGNFQEPHVDHIDPNFDLNSIDLSNIPEECQYFFEERNIEKYKKLFTNKAFTSIIYLNDDYVGGELYFPQHNNFEIKPKKGTMLIFSGTIDNMHGIKEITNGTRYTHVTFWSNNISKSSKIAFDKKVNRLLIDKDNKPIMSVSPI
jgi:hypothetical protein